MSAFTNKVAVITGGNSAGRFDYLERVAVAGNSNINPAPEEVIDDA